MALLLVLTVSTGASFCQPVAAADTSVNSSMSNDEIQSILDTAGAGDTITFLSGIYNNVVLTVSTALNLVGNDAILNSAGSSTIFTIVGTAASGTNVTGFTLNGSGSNMAINATNTDGIDIANNIFNNNKRAIYFSNVNNSSIQSNDIYNNTEFGLYISDAGNLTSLNNLLIDGNRLINSTGGMSIGGSGFSIVNNYIDMYNSTSVGISGGTVYNTLIQNNTINNGGDAVNLAGTVLNYTIDKNTINNMTRRYGDGISIMNHDNTTVYDSITNNVVNNAFYGMFLGGYFTGNISGNSINNTGTAAVNFTQKMGPGNLKLNFTNNSITNAGNIGIAIEVPATYLDMENNTINSSRFSIEYGKDYKNNGQVIIGSNNIISNTQNFKVASTMTNDYIQSIIDGANAGDTITFLAGTYTNMTFTVTKALNLVSNGAILNNNITSSIISITGTNASGTNITGFKFNGNGTNYGINANNTYGLNILSNVFNNTKRAVNFNNVNNSLIQANNVSNNTEYGIYISDTGNLTSLNNLLIDRNNLINSSGGIHVGGSGYAITNNYIDNYNNTNYNGIDSSSLYSALIENNTVLNGADGINLFMTIVNVTVNNNYVNHMKGSYGDGISLITHTQIGTSRITNNYVNDTNYGIWEGGFIGTISGNTINNSAITAMNLTSKMSSGGLNANITNNNIINAANIGVAIEVTVNNLNMDYNNISSNSYSIEYSSNYMNNGTVNIGSSNILSNTQNFKVASTMNNTYIQSIIDGANSGDTVTFLAGTYSNIALTIAKAINMVGNGAILSNNGTSSTITVTGTGASGTNITGFTITGAADNGVNLNSVDNVSIKNNNITGNTNSGVAISDSDNNVVSGNNITSNGENGVSVKSSSKNQVKDNTISKNGGHGVSLNNSDNSTVTDNEISENEEDGVNEDTSNDNQVENNNIHANGGNGVSLTDSNNNTVTGNEVYDNVERGVNISNSNNNNLSNNVYSNGITVNVSSVDPTNGAYINTSKNITVTFSDPIQRGSGLIKLLKNGTSVAFTTSINGKLLTIIPTSALTNGTYQVILYNGSITDLMGNPVVLSSTSFTMDNVKPTATANPAGGTYTTSKSVTLTMSKNGTIYYTIDGTTPTTSSTKYTGPITISKTTTLKYLALDEAGNLSNVYTQLYTINTATPKVTKTNPTTGATGVLLSSAIYIKFSENIKSSTNFSGIIIKNMTTGKIVTGYTKTISGDTLKLKMSSNRLKNCVYKVYIPAKAVKNSLGSNLATSYSFTFKTKA